MPTKTESIKLFLQHKARPDLAELYNHDMECQVNVFQADGEPFEGQFKGKQWRGYKKGNLVWKPIRIPYGAKDNPEYNDGNMNWPLEQYAEGIGMTGWDWVARVSKWVAFDFDGIVGHSENHSARLDPKELARVREEAFRLKWVTVRRSSSGTGLHLYVFLPDVPTANHTEHAALARAILGQMSLETGFDFSSRVDVCGANTWIWHKKMEKSQGTGFELLKKGEMFPETSIPLNWRDHVEVIRGKKKRATSTDLESTAFEDIHAARQNASLEPEHKKLITWLQENGHVVCWDNDNKLLSTHTIALREAHKALKLKGVFETTSVGSTSINCFAFPMRGGVWSVRRYGQSANEHPCWSKDKSGWTRAYFNKEADFTTACKAFGGIEVPDKKSFEFETLVDAELAMKALNSPLPEEAITTSLAKRATLLRLGRDGRPVVECDQRHGDTKPNGWRDDTKTKKWTYVATKVAELEAADGESQTADELVRHLVSNGENADWVANIGDRWFAEPLPHIKLFLSSHGFNTDKTTEILGNAVSKPWVLVNEPFQGEYPGGRMWNRDAAQFAYPVDRTKTEFKIDTWMTIFNHIGRDLNAYVGQYEWCAQAGIKTGGEYLLFWVGSMFQYPKQPLPYLFLFSEAQNTGKSSFHEALSLLLTKGVARVDNALINQAGFNGEMEGSILDIIEETELDASKVAANRVKDWVTSPRIAIHRKGVTPYDVQNTCHFVQTSNSIKSCPTITGDTRVTMIRVFPLKSEISKAELLERCAREASDFLSCVLQLEIPKSAGRLRIPVITTGSKTQFEDSNVSALDRFVRDALEPSEGSVLVFADVYEKFMASMQDRERAEYSTKKVGARLGQIYEKGKRRSDNATCIGNVYWRGVEDPKRIACKYVTIDSQNGPILVPESSIKKAKEEQDGARSTPKNPELPSM